MSAPRAGDVLARRYVLTEPLGEGASAVVFRARDRWHERDVAVKLIASDDAIALARREHELASETTHPALVPALDVGRSGEHAFVVFELAEGDSFDRALAGCEDVSIAFALDDLLGGLGFLHGRGLIHGDLKPANVRVRSERGRSRARLLDLGLARAPGEQGGGNTAYGAPEALGGAATVASDLFSAGVMAYEAACGALPFGDPADPRYLARLLGDDRIAPPVALPPRLAPIVERLCATDPRTRFRTALDARAALRACFDELSAGDVEPLAAPPLIGRDALLDRAGALLHDHDAHPLVLCGVGGSGRTRTLRRVAAEARLRGLATLEVSAAGGIRSLLDALLEQMQRLGADVEHATEAVARTGTGEIHAALFSVLDALRTLSGSAMVAVDDVDRCDDSTRRAVHFLADVPAEGRIGWLLVDSRSRTGTVLELEPLDEQAVERLVGAMLPSLPEAGVLARASVEQGCCEPAQIVDGVLRLVRTGAVRFSETGWQASAEGLEIERFLEPGPSLVRARVAELRPDDRALLAAMALAGGSIEGADLGLGFPAGERARAVRAGLGAGLLREGAGRASFAGPRAREALIETLDADERRSARERIAGALRDAPSLAAHRDRARHLAALHRYDEAAAVATAAARIALSEGQPSSACELLASAIRWGGPAVAREAALDHAQLLAAQGDVEPALDVLIHAREAGVSQSEVDRMRGRIMARAGRYADAIEALTHVARSQGAPVEDRYWLGWALMMRGRYDEASELASETPDDARDRARLGRLAGTIAWHRGRADEACTILSLARADALSAGDPLVQVEIEQSLGTAERIRGRLDEAGARLAEAVRLARSHGFAATLAKALNNLAINEYQAGRWESAARSWEAMRELAVRLGAREEVLLAHNNLGLVYRDRGEHARAAASLERALTLAREAGVARYEAMVLGNLAEVHALSGELDTAACELDAAERIARTIDAAGELLECAIRRAALALARSDAPRALALACSAAEQAGDAHLERGNALLVAAAAARQLRRLDEAAARLAAAREAFEAGGTRVELARADLEDARLLAVRGDRVGSKAKARVAAHAFAELGAARELAEARALEDQDEVADRTAALLELLQCSASAPDIDSLLSSVLDRLLILTRAERGFVLLLEGERAPRIAAVRGVDEGSLPRLSRGIADRVVTSGKAIVLANLGEELELASRESVMGMGLRAALCAPLVRSERCLGLLYVDSRCGPELVRFGLWMLDAASAILVPALERLLDAELERERLALLRGSAVDTLEMLASIDAALDLVDGEQDPAARGRWIAAAREHVRGAAARSEGLLQLVRSGEETARDESEAVALELLLRTYAPLGKIEMEPGAPVVRGGLEPLCSLVGRMIDVVGGQVDDASQLSVSASPVDECAAPGSAGWRPGQSAGRSFVRIAVWTRGPAARPELLDADGSPDALALRAARRIARRCGGRLTRVQDGLRLGLVAELEGTWTEEAA